MTNIINTATIPFTAELEVEKKRYPLARFEVVYLSNIVMQATADLAIGRKSDAKNLTGTTGFQQQVEFERGTPAKLFIHVDKEVVDPAKPDSVLIPKGRDRLLFEGLVDDTGPSNLSKNSFSLRISLVSRTAKLNTGAVQLHRLAPQTFIDTSCSISAFGSDSPIAPNVDSFSPSDLQKDFWKELQRIMIAIATIPVSVDATTKNPAALAAVYAALKKAGADDVNSLANETLRIIAGNLVFNSIWTEPSYQTNLARWLNIQFTTTFLMRSFLTRIQELGNEFKYRLIENPMGIAIVPYSPFFQSSDAVPIYPSTCTQINWSSREPESCGGGIMLVAGPKGDGQSGDYDAKVAVHVRPGFKGDKKPLGMIFPVQGPDWMYSLIEGHTDQVLQFNSMISRIGPGYVKEQVLDTAYRGRTVMLACPFRLDIGCLMPVKVIYPKIVGVNDASSVDTAIYGSVQMVKLTADAVGQTASTTIEVGYVRSSVQQKAEFDDEPYVHPIWTSRYIGAKLTQSPELGVKPI